MSGGTADQRAAGAGLCGDSGTRECPASPKGGCTEDPGHSGPAGEESLLNWTHSLVCGSLSLAVFFFQIFCGHNEGLDLFSELCYVSVLSPPPPPYHRDIKDRPEASDKDPRTR